MIPEQQKELKEFYGHLMKLEAAEMTKKNPKPDFSRWPPEMPERPCPWRQSDELQKYRLRVPEPCQVDYPVVKYQIDSEPDWSACFSDAVPFATHFETGLFSKQLFVTEDGSSHYAWTADGKTPIYPTPMEENL